MRRLLPLAVLAGLLVAPEARAERRFAIVLGDDAGDATDPPLRFAESDARRTLEVLVDVGGVSRTDALLLLDVTAREVREALAAVRSRLEREGYGPSDRLLVYVSSHADPRELHLKGTRFPLAELRAFVESAPAGLVVLVLDTCHAAAVTRAKGLRALSSTEVVVEAPKVAGRVVIASASPEEPAFESDGLGGSVFTQHWLAGLRGAADVSRDGAVSLQEAYGYAYTRTLETSATLEGARQTPAFDFSLAGTGDVVLSEPDKGSARLVLDVESGGEWVFTPIVGGAAVRLVKPQGRVTLALGGGGWRLRARRGDVFLEGEVTVVDGGLTRLAEADLQRFRAVPAGRKGNASELVPFLHGSVGSAVVGGVTQPLGWATGVRWVPESGPGFARVAWKLGVEHRVSAGLAQRFVEREVALVLGGGLSFPTGPLRTRLLAIGGAWFVSQENLPGGARFGTQPMLGAELGLEWLLPVGGLRLDFALSGGGALVSKQSGTYGVPVLAAALGVAFGP